MCGDLVADEYGTSLFLLKQGINVLIISPHKSFLIITAAGLVLGLLSAMFQLFPEVLDVLSIRTSGEVLLADQFESRTFWFDRAAVLQRL